MRNLLTFITRKQRIKCTPPWPFPLQQTHGKLKKHTKFDSCRIFFIQPQGSIVKTLLKFTIAAIVLAIGILFFNYYKKQTPTHSEKPSIRLGISADNPPFTFVKDGAFVGFEIDLAHALSSRMNHTLDILDLDFGGLIPAVKNDIIDLAIAGFNITEERKKNIAFSDNYYTGETGVISNQAFSSPAELAHTKIGVQHGSVWEAEAKKIAATYEGIEVIGFHRINQIVQELEQKTINAILIDTPVARQITQSHPKFIVSTLASLNEEQGMGVIFKQGSPLINECNKALAEIKQNGTLKKISEKWFNTEQS